VTREEPTQMSRRHAERVGQIAERLAVVEKSVVDQASRARDAGRRPPPKDLDVKDAKVVRGGRKAGETPVEYLKIKMSDILITG
jgi:hypothetical protein